MQLIDHTGKCVASCTAVHEGNKLSVRRRHEEPLYLPAIRLGMTGQLIFGYLRIAAILTMFASCANHAFALSITLYWVAFVLDVGGR